MVPLAALWLPILLSAVIVFVASSLIHMVLPWHKNDYPKVPDEDALRGASSREGLRDPTFLEKVRQGPNVILTVLPTGSMSMARNLGQWFVYLLVVSLFTAYVAGRTLTAGVPYLQVFRITGAVAFLGYAAALWQMSIWYRRAWSTTLKATVDGLIYSLLTAGTFGWLWPR
jgi:high-affinity Fe2+/Pb2+ permease